MGNKKGVNLTWLLIALMLGITLFKHFNFQTFSFRMPVLDIIFLITLVVTIYFIIKDFKNRSKT